MGNLFGSKPKSTTVPAPTPEESEGKSRLKQQEAAKRRAAQETLLTSVEEEKAKLLG